LRGNRERAPDHAGHQTDRACGAYGPQKSSPLEILHGAQRRSGEHGAAVVVDVWDWPAPAPGALALPPPPHATQPTSSAAAPSLQVRIVKGL